MRASSSVTSPARGGHPHRVLRSRTHLDDGALRATAERQRIAGRLHDEVSPLLFAAAAGVQRTELRPDADVAELREALRRAGDQVAAATAQLRAVLRDCSPVDPADGVPAAAHRDVQDYAARTGQSACLRVVGRPRGLGASVERAVLSCLRLALCNVEQHAAASTVDVVLDYRPDHVVLRVQDDGRGLPTGFETHAMPAAGHRWGLASMTRQAEQHGGTVEIDDVGGTRLRVHLPG